MIFNFLYSFNKFLIEFNSIKDKESSNREVCGGLVWLWGLGSFCVIHSIASKLLLFSLKAKDAWVRLGKDSMLE